MIKEIINKVKKIIENEALIEKSSTLIFKNLDKYFESIRNKITKEDLFYIYLEYNKKWEYLGWFLL